VLLLNFDEFGAIYACQRPILDMILILILKVSFITLFVREKSNNNRFFGGLGILIKKNIRKGIALLQN
jgi:hypothetical protein